MSTTYDLVHVLYVVGEIVAGSTLPVNVAFAAVVSLPQESTDQACCTLPISASPSDPGSTPPCSVPFSSTLGSPASAPLQPNASAAAVTKPQMVRSLSSRAQ